MYPLIAGWGPDHAGMVRSTLYVLCCLHHYLTNKALPILRHSIAANVGLNHFTRYKI